jgi:Raf kinase inhibitor-like YbhB/YbcL family protein
MMNRLLFAITTVAILLPSCTAAPSATATSQPTEMEVLSAITASPEPALIPTDTLMPLTLTSTGFTEGSTIPAEFGCTGANRSPQLDWTEPPAGTQSFALIFDDPDASSRGFVHWVVYNIPADARSLWEGIPADPVIHDSAVHGTNGWGRMDYGGPCPPQGSTHRYVFTLYALDTLLDLQPGATREELQEALRVHVLAEARLTAMFGR